MSGGGEHRDPVLIEVTYDRDGISSYSRIEIPRDQWVADHDELGEVLSGGALRALRQAETTRDRAAEPF